ncbi:MAG: 16S rRNA (guanine1516-N2)-methyltransferase [Gammaproteobacteria bacterium]|jgi:16S rRNA (guanine1516-N2)-methyltransferase|tara:strand:- start:1401 stop:2135 length:735 start_codon:yes stop_codon:yes gene_type:complete
MSIDLFISEPCQIDGLENILKKYNLKMVNDQPSQGPFVGFGEKGFYFVEDASNLLNILHIDFLSGSMGWRLKRSDHETLLKKTLGKSKGALTIFDGTAGLLSDSIIFLSLGHSVVACEQSKILHLLVQDACKRAESDLPFLKNLTFINGDSLEAYKEYSDIDVVYLDPLYPEIKKNILRSGDINYIRGLLDLESIDDRADFLFDEFKKLNCKKIILKRPIKADKLDKNINYQVKGKSTRFDIYL